ncbi:hypothetical protein MUN82_08765 [Hymenobacter aerilatus]|uniref:Uncharacterized protein n=1 Tax=Hymenobacter aerilatus TaxID=2932251 RepID=A0A8T9T1X0_9BACT|nr:hypothetical protein [Hymenobacter aerilatus]UOR07174.1 hypothetical protein MUN82_08765 [Hymenobacter aerilatus]
MSTTLQLLQAYPLGTLEVETPDGPGILVGLRYFKLSKRYIADVDGVETQSVNGYSVADVRPRLRSFDQLCTALPDKTVPAVEVAKIVTTGSCSTRTVTFTTTYIGSGWVVDFSNGYFVRIDDTWDMIVGLQHAGKQLPVDLKNAFAAADYLRNVGQFALPLNGTPLVEGQDYIRKV